MFHFWYIWHIYFVYGHICPYMYIYDTCMDIYVEAYTEHTKDIYVNWPASI